MTNHESIARLAAIDAESFKLRLILALLADDDGVVAIEKNDLAVMFGVSRATFQRRLNVAKVGVDSIGRIVVTPAPHGLTQICVDVLDNDSIDSNVSLKRIDAKSLIEYFRTKHDERYGVKPKVDYRIALPMAKRFLRLYGDDSIRLLDYIFANYDQTWSTAQFRTPAFGAVFGWIAEKAIVTLRKNDTSKTSTIASIEEMI